MMVYTRRGRSRAQHVQNREADIERAKKWEPGHLRRSKGDRGPQGRAHIWVMFSCKGVQRGEWPGPKGRADALAVVVLWRKKDRAARPVGPSRRARFWWRLIKNAKF